MDAPKRMVLAYSGGLDTSVAIVWLQQRYGCDVIAYCADVGQGEDLAAVERKALQTGAKKCVVEDLREEFVRDFVYPALRANAAYEHDYLMGTSLARPLIAKGMMAVVAREGADSIAHGATGKGNDQVRFELSAYHFNPDIRIIAPWREWDLRSRSQLIAYTKEHKIPIEATLEKPYSIDRNLLHTSYEGGILEDPSREPDRSMYQLTVDPEKAPDQPRTIEITFEAGNPVAIDGARLGPVALLAQLNEVAGGHGVGRVDIVENRFVGMKARGVYETPGGTVLKIAHRAVETVTMDREVMRLRDSLVPQFAAMIYNGFWYAPERELLQELIDSSQRTVHGTARVRLYKGTCSVIGRAAAPGYSLYDPEIATFEQEGVYDQHHAEGFIRLHALRLRTRARLRKRVS